MGSPRCCTCAGCGAEPVRTNSAGPGLRPDVRLGGITTIASLSEALAAGKPGQKTSVTYTRDGSAKTVEVTLGEQ
ncbi:conserved hypothetical protein [Streptomyces sviceus ATCC 29083]|uniref:PDZ domain-containing protein n=1 Tax=Streptomyces sviceus (strain ATCC 29083 / DSM 924 / JCM 4929 / NBRC 13980 / NCIMB 11184 / NRRL 5439 / UC 5370) TaxID=463191 RepID=B5I259_STRX2|nr:conserved hypothetical protein [Streptomyces sviceus ATCC 29083]